MLNETLNAYQNNAEFDKSSKKMRNISLRENIWIFGVSIYKQVSRFFS